MIEVDHLTKHYGQTPAVEDVSFRVEKGEILGFLGPNGAGKTTTMRMITCYLPPTSGTARVAGYDVFSDSMEVRRRIGYLPEHPPLYTDMTVASYLDFVSKIKGVESKQRKSAVDRTVERCGLSDKRDTIIAKLSKGYRQRVGIAQALVHDPEVLVLDEPTIGLDPRQIIEVRELIKSLAGDHTVILSTHILSEASMTCQRMVIINKGRIVAMDTPENLKARLMGADRIYVQVKGPSEAVSAKLREVPNVAGVVAEPGGNGTCGFFVDSREKTDIRAELAASIVGSGFGLLEMKPVGMSLEEIFLQLTAEEEEGS
ncbi:MAG: ATP-binding cassette domain-containing protein [Candidatus Latescibacterota bacterium]